MAKIFLTLLLTISLAHTVQALEITFKTKCAVSSSVIKLGDIAKFDKQSEMAKALATLTVGQASAPGEKVSLRSITIKNYLVSSQTLPNDIRWTGSPTITVERRGIKVGPAKIQEIITKYIDSNKSSLPEAEIRFIPHSLPLPFVLPEGNLRYEVIPSKPGILGSSRLSIIFRNGENVVKNMSVRGKIEALAEVVVSTHNLKRGKVLRPEDLSSVIMDISSVHKPELEFANLIGKRLKRNLRTGTPVLTTMVEPMPIVHRGDRVKIVVNSGSMQLTATGLARSDGILDQMIRVQNSNSMKIIHCRVAAPGLVEVML